MNISDINQLGTILGVWAHPDDESFMMAGLMAAAAENGQTVACITATKGEAGQFDPAKYTAETLGETRAQELQSAFKILGVKNHHWLGYKDGHCHEVDDKEAVRKIYTYIKKVQPDTIITFPPDGLTGHDDHKAVSRWARQAIRQSGRKITLYYAVDTKEKYDQYFKEIDEKFNIYFNIDEPVLVPLAKCDLVFNLSTEQAKKKMRALKAMTSQTEGMFKQFGEQLFIDTSDVETFVKADSKDPSRWPIK